MKTNLQLLSSLSLLCLFTKGQNLCTQLEELVSHFVPGDWEHWLFTGIKCVLCSALGGLQGARNGNNPSSTWNI